MVCGGFDIYLLIRTVLARTESTLSALRLVRNSTQANIKSLGLVSTTKKLMFQYQIRPFHGAGLSGPTQKFGDPYRGKYVMSDLITAGPSTFARYKFRTSRRPLNVASVRARTVRSSEQRSKDPVALTGRSADRDAPPQQKPPPQPARPDRPRTWGRPCGRQSCGWSWRRTAPPPPGCPYSRPGTDRTWV